MGIFLHLLVISFHRKKAAGNEAASAASVLHTLLRASIFEESYQKYFKRNLTIFRLSLLTCAKIRALFPRHGTIEEICMTLRCRTGYCAPFIAWPSVSVGHENS
jgi:hypothetical protein